ncbi:MAG: nitrilase-related carbon-nitrogen hydrolase [Methanocorpusculum sp.]|nr:nitrilase-related carbon-nitrogen hydrolase [Methanocorpusculum sp.]
MKICCAQIPQIFDDPSAAFLKAEEFISGSDADLIIFPEQYACGWRAAPCSAAGYDRVQVREMWRSLAVKYHKCLVGSYQEGTPGEGKPFNTFFAVSPEGETIARYHKIHLFSPAGEDEHFSPGQSPAVFSFMGIRFGCAVCFDLRFPELFREYLRAGCECVIVQAAWPAARAADWELLLRARAVENRCYVAGCCTLGYDAETNTDYCGRSMICSPDGKILADAGVFEGGCDTVFDADEVTSSVAELRRVWIPVHPDKD